RPRVWWRGGDRGVCGGRHREGMSEWIGGRRPVVEALTAGRPAARLLVAQSARPGPELNEVLAAARSASVRVESVDANQVRRLAGFDGHQGVLLEVEDRRFADLADLLAMATTRGHDPMILILEHLQDPTN